MLERKDKHLVCLFNRKTRYWDILWDYGFEWIPGIRDSRYEHIITSAAPDGSPMMPSSKQLNELDILDFARRCPNAFKRELREREDRRVAAEERQADNESEDYAKDRKREFAKKLGWATPYVQGAKLT